jgi:hypothetical protein
MMSVPWSFAHPEGREFLAADSRDVGAIKYCFRDGGEVVEIPIPDNEPRENNQALFNRTEDSGDPVRIGRMPLLSCLCSQKNSAQNTGFARGSLYN